jgi:hypothetical protein
MDIFFADHSTERALRQGMGHVIAIGGVFVDETALRPLATAVDAIARGSGDPRTQKSGGRLGRTSWIYQELHGDAKADSQLMQLGA